MIGLLLRTNPRLGLSGNVELRSLADAASSAESAFDAVVPVSFYYDGPDATGQAERRKGAPPRRAQLERWKLWKRLLSGRPLAARIHIRCGIPLRRSEGSLLELHLRGCETDDSQSLRRFLESAQLKVDANWLSDALQRRGGQVVRAKRHRPASYADEELPSWYWRFLPEVAERFPDQFGALQGSDRTASYLSAARQGEPRVEDAEILGRVVNEIARRLARRPQPRESVG